MQGSWVQGAYHQGSVIFFLLHGIEPFVVKVHSDTFSIDLEKKPNVTRAEDVHYITVEKFAFFQREDGISVQGGRVLVSARTLELEDVADRGRGRRVPGEQGPVLATLQDRRASHVAGGAQARSVFVAAT